MSKKEELAFDRVLAAVLTFNHCSGCGPSGEVGLAKTAVHAASELRSPISTKAKGEANDVLCYPNWGVNDDC